MNICKSCIELLKPTILKRMVKKQKKKKKTKKIAKTTADKKKYEQIFLNCELVSSVNEEIIFVDFVHSFFIISKSSFHFLAPQVPFNKNSFSISVYGMRETSNFFFLLLNRLDHDQFPSKSVKNVSFFDHFFYCVGRIEHRWQCAFQ